MVSTRRAAVVLPFVLLFAGCSATSAQQPRYQVPTDVVATVGSTSITLAQVDEKALQLSTNSFGSSKLFQALYDARRAVLEDMIGSVLIDEDAKTRGVDRAKLLEEEVTAKVTQPTDEEIKAFYDTNQSRMQGATFEQASAPIKNYLVQERTTAARRQYLDRLKAKGSVKVLLDPPRHTIATAGHPSRGPANAPIELVEFADFQCPYCLQSHPTVAQVLNTYGDRIRFVYRHYPLPSHPNARPAAEAAVCATEQDKFWQYYEALFADPRKLGDADLKATAARLGMDSAKFDLCVDSHKYKDVVDNDLRDGNAAGVTGTPAFFINGRPLVGAMPFDQFKRIIDEELALKGSR
jgi:protein-disulfide isomerase